jgi:hypothetical protein
VKITFPRQNEGGEGRTREQLKSDEVLVKGGKKGVAQAKSELLDVRKGCQSFLLDLLIHYCRRLSSKRN